MSDKTLYAKQKKFSKNRQIVTEFVSEGKRKNVVYGLVPIDITDARKIFKNYKQKTGETLSLTSWVLVCLAHGVQEHLYMNSYRKGTKSLVSFKDVDVSTVIEKDVNGVKYPTNYIVKSANTKSLMDVHNEIRKAQRSKTGLANDGGSQKKKQSRNIVAMMPKFVRKFFFWLMRTNPDLKKKFTGTIGLSAVGMIGKSGGYMIPITPHTLSIGVGGISSKPRFASETDDTIVRREIVDITVSFDHDIIDGGPGIRFINNFLDKMESAYGLEAFKEIEEDKKLEEVKIIEEINNIRN